MAWVDAAGGIGFPDCPQLFEDYRKVYDFGRTWSHEEYISKVGG